MQKRKKKDGHAKIFIEKLQSEVKQTQVAIYREFDKNTGDEEFNMLEQFNRLSLQALCQLLGTFMPICKLQKEDSYLIGTEVKNMAVRGVNCMVRVGGGYVDIKDYYNNYATKQCVSMHQRMKSSNFTLKQAIIDLLTKNGAAPEIIEAHQVCNDDDWQSANDLFLLLSVLIEEKTNDLVRKSPKKLKRKGSQAGSGNKYANLSPVRGGQLH